MSIYVVVHTENQDRYFVYEGMSEDVCLDLASEFGTAEITTEESYNAAILPRRPAL